MKDVARLLGVEIGEEFKLGCAKAKYKITEQGIYYFDEISKTGLNNLAKEEINQARLVRRTIR